MLTKRHFYRSRTIAQKCKVLVLHGCKLRREDTGIHHHLQGSKKGELSQARYLSLIILFLNEIRSKNCLVSVFWLISSKIGLSLCTCDSKKLNAIFIFGSIGLVNNQLMFISRLEFNFSMRMTSSSDSNQYLNTARRKSKYGTQRLLLN